MKPEQHVVSALIRQPNTNKYLIALRPKEDNNGGVWEFPGGKVDKTDKDLREALKREVFEELSVKVDKMSHAPIKTLRFETQDKILVMHFFLVYLKKSSCPFPVEHIDIDYVDVLKLPRIPNFSEGQKPIIQLLQQKHINDY